MIEEERCLDKDSENRPDYPVIFQCSECRAIIGDSLSWVCGNECLKSITLRSKLFTSCPLLAGRG